MFQDQLNKRIYSLMLILWLFEPAFEFVFEHAVPDRK